MYCIDELDEALWVSGMSCAIIAHERESLDRIFEIVKRAFVNLPEEIKPVTKYDTKRMYQFTNRFDGMPLDSSIYVAMKLRSGTVYRLHITESSKITDRQELDAGSKQAVPIEGYISEETTGNGFEGFYDLYMANFASSTPGELDYKCYFYPWFDNPDYILPGNINEYTKNEIDGKHKFGWTDGQIIWRRWKMGELRRDQHGVGLTGEQLFKQEYPSTPLEAFQSGAGHVFNAEKVSTLIPLAPLTDNDARRIIWEKYTGEVADSMYSKFLSLYNKGVWFWKIPEMDRKYVGGVDPSDGEGADFGDIDIWDRDSEEQVAQFYGKLRPDELAELAAELARFYKGARAEEGAYLGVENNMLTTILFLSKTYTNYYYDVKIDEKTFKRTKKIGWSTNSKTRDVMIDDFAIHFDEDHLTIHSKITIGEMKTFVKKDTGKREHADGKHDDGLFGGMIAIQMIKFDTPRVRTFENKPF